MALSISLLLIDFSLECEWVKESATLIGKWANVQKCDHDLYIIPSAVAQAERSTCNSIFTVRRIGGRQADGEKKHIPIIAQFYNVRIYILEKCAIVIILEVRHYVEEIPMNNHSFRLTAIFLVKSAVAAQVDDWCQGDSCMIFLLLYFAKEACHIIVLDVIQGLLYKVRRGTNVHTNDRNLYRHSFFFSFFFLKIRNDEFVMICEPHVIW